MNIFFLDWNPVVAAQSHCDQHVVKMVTETSQLLSAVHWNLHSPKTMNPLVARLSHGHHPCTLWAMQTIGNYDWLVRLGLALADEYHFRHHGIHADRAVIRLLRHPPLGVPTLGHLTPPARAFSDYRTDAPDAVDAYRAFYHSKPFRPRWSLGRAAPGWWRGADHPDHPDHPH